MIIAKVQFAGGGKSTASLSGGRDCEEQDGETSGGTHPRRKTPLSICVVRASHRVEGGVRKLLSENRLLDRIFRSKRQQTTTGDRSEAARGAGRQYFQNRLSFGLLPSGAAANRTGLLRHSVSAPVNA